MTQHIINNSVSQFLGREYTDQGFYLVEDGDDFLELRFKEAFVARFTIHAEMGEVQAEARRYIEGLNDGTQ